MKYDNAAQDTIGTGYGSDADSPWTTIEQLRAELAIVRAKSEQRKGALLRVEWVGGFISKKCPWCGGLLLFGGHNRDCKREKALED